jgi:hypothetical protein
MSFTPTGLCKDITGLGRRVNVDVGVGMDSLDMLDYVMAIIKQAFSNCRMWSNELIFAWRCERMRRHFYTINNI